MSFLSNFPNNFTCEIGQVFTVAYLFIRNDCDERALARDEAFSVMWRRA